MTITPTIDDDDLLPDSEALTDEQIVRITDRLAGRQGTLASYLLGPDHDTDNLMKHLTGGDVDRYRRLCLSGMPRDAGDVYAIARKHDVDVDRLRDVFSMCGVPFIGHRSVGG